LTTSDIIRSIENTNPLSTIAKEEVDAIIHFASSRMRPANAPYYKPEGDQVGDRFSPI